jgi:hypothetical protein
MSNYSYKVVPFLGKVKSGQGASVVSNQLQNVIDQYSNEGWEFYSLSSTNIEVAPGCLAALFGAKASYVTFDQIIFRKQV